MRGRGWPPLKGSTKRTIDSDVQELIPPDERMPIMFDRNVAERRRLVGARVRENEDGDLIKEAYSFEDEVATVDQFNDNVYDNSRAHISVPFDSTGFSNEPVVNVYVKKYE